MIEEAAIRRDVHGRGRREILAGAVILIATLGGLGVAIWTIQGSQLAAIVRILRGMGIGGFAAYCLYSVAVFGVLGMAWLVAMGETPGRLAWFTAARLLREAASDLLPFSQIGGIIVSTRMLASRGLDVVRIHASLVVDLTTELAGQLLFTIFGIAVAAATWSGGSTESSLRTGILCSIPMILAILIMFLSVPRWLPRIAGGILARVMPGSTVVLKTVAVEVAAIHAQPLRMAMSFALNLTAWVLSAAGAWVALRFMQVDFSFVRIVSLEALVFALRTVAFMVPGGIGVQEAAYVLAAPHFGLPLESAMALAFAKRARDLAVGVPTLIVWQLAEARHLFGARNRHQRAAT